MAQFSLLLDRYKSSADPLHSERRIELVALILTVVLAFQLLYGVANLLLRASPQPILPAADSLLVSDIRQSGVVSAQHSSDLRARPVFWPSRRSVGAPAEVVVVNTTKPNKNELDKVTLLGVFGVGDSAGIIALVKGKKKRILLGDKVVGWALESIEGGQAVFAEGGQSQTLTLNRAPVVEPVAAVPTVAPAQAGTGKQQQAKLSFGVSPTNNESRRQSRDNKK